MEENETSEKETRLQEVSENVIRSMLSKGICWTAATSEKENSL